MHQIRLRLGLRARLSWGSLQRSPDPLAEFKVAYFEGREGAWKGKGKEGGEGKQGEGRGEGQEGKG